MKRTFNKLANRMVLAAACAVTFTQNVQASVFTSAKGAMDNLNTDTAAVVSGIFKWAQYLLAAAVFISAVIAGYKLFTAKPDGVETIIKIGIGAIVILGLLTLVKAWTGIV